MSNRAQRIDSCSSKYAGRVRKTPNTILLTSIATPWNYQSLGRVGDVKSKNTVVSETERSVLIKGDMLSFFLAH
jgi:hypothetical protein